MASHFVGAVKEHMDRLAKAQAGGGTTVVISRPQMNDKQQERRIVSIATKAPGLYPWVGKGTGV